MNHVVIHCCHFVVVCCEVVKLRCDARRISAPSINHTHTFIHLI